MALTQAEILRTVQAVLTGGDASGRKVTRDSLAEFALRELAYVAFAIMLARPDRYLNSSRGTQWLQGYLNATLQEIVVDGVPHEYASGGTLRYARVSGNELVRVCRNAGLYSPEPGKGGGKNIWITPPKELIALVAEFGNHPAVDAFCEAVEEGARIRNLPETWQVTGRNGSSQVQADRMIDWLKGLDPETYDALVKRLPAK
ncbi:MAG TPA: hypothetical protein VM581_03685 [Magnetospirillaceae bacterium]|nr:hypothetical protein [Magnetospirillaceae bacterium]